MSITVICPRCQRFIRVLNRTVSERTDCPECGDSFTVPVAPRSAARAAESLPSRIGLALVVVALWTIYIVVA
jgi:transposase-like protein